MTYSAAEYADYFGKLFLQQSAQALSPYEAAMELTRRKAELPRASGIPDPNKRTPYHLKRQRERPTEAITPGEHTIIKAFPIAEPKPRKKKSDPKTYQFTPGTFSVYPRYYKAACRGDGDAWLALCELLDHFDRDQFRRTGTLFVKCVSLYDIARIIGKSIQTASRVMKRLEKRRILAIHRVGKGQPNAYILASYLNGAWTFPVGHAHSPVPKYLEAQARAASGGSTEPAPSPGRHDEEVASHIQELFASFLDPGPPDRRRRRG